MPDIFISYASQDRTWVKGLAEALQSLGWSIWWDREIPGGGDFSEVIEKALSDSRCVLVVWSQDSVESNWVREEAEEGRKRDVLIPIFMEEVTPPMGFRSIQSVPLMDWDGHIAAPSFLKLVADVAAVIGPPPHPVQGQSFPRRRGLVYRMRSSLWLFAGASAVVLAGITGMLYYHHSVQRNRIDQAARLADTSVTTLNQVLKIESDNPRSYWWYVLEKRGGAELLERSVLLAAESMHHASSPSGEQALRRALGYLTRPAASLKCFGREGSAAFSPDSRRWAAADPDEVGRIWDLSLDREIPGVHPESQIATVAWSPDGRYLATGGSQDGTARIWDVAAGTELAAVQHGGSDIRVLFAADGRHITTSSRSDGKVRVWSVPTGREVAVLEHEFPIRDITLSPDGTYLAVSNDADNRARIWELASHRAATQLEHDGGLLALAFSVDGRLVATGSRDKTGRLWEVSTGREALRVQHGSYVYAVAISPNNDFLATAGNATRVKLWEIRSGRLMQTLPHSDRIFDVEFSPDSEYLASASQDTTARLWKVADGAELARFSHADNVNQVVFSLDGRYLLTVGQDHAAKVWNLWPGDDLLAESCHRLERNLTTEEWTQFVGKEPYRKTCPGLP